MSAHDESTVGTSRRDFIRVSAVAGGGLLLGLHLPTPSRARGAGAQESLPRRSGVLTPNAWIRLTTDGTLTVMIDKAEMGQGVVTALATLIADEMDADWTKVKTELAHDHQAHEKLRGGGLITGGSSTVRTSWMPLRTAGAAAREMLVAAAAARWGVDPSGCTTSNHAVVHAGTGRSLGYGELAADAAAIPVPAAPHLKDPSQFRYLGRRIKRLDSPGKVNGTARYGIDVKVPGMLVATVQRPPMFGGKVTAFDASRAKAVAGVRHVVQIGSGVAVVGDGYWPALSGRRVLKVTYDAGPNASRSTDSIARELRAAAASPGAVVRNDGDVAAAVARAAKRVEAEYEVPFLAHATMEPMNATAWVHDGQVEIWAPTQAPTWARQEVAKLTGIAEDRIVIYPTLLGGGFGRRAEPDFVLEAVEVSMKTGAPVKVIWSREDDMQHDHYRPAAYNKLGAALDADGWPIAWSCHIVGPSIGYSHNGPAGLRNGVDGSSIEGSANLPYAIPNLRVEYTFTDVGVPCGWWRSVGSSQNAYVTEAFLDEIAAAGGKDPLELRRRLLVDKPKYLAVLDLAAEKAGWGTPLPKGRYRGIALHRSFGTTVAEVAEISLPNNGSVRVHRVVCAVDCGQVVNPDTVEAQMEGGIVYGLSAALYGRVDIEKGGAKQSNFHDYRMLHMAEMPRVEVHILPSAEPPSGVGEPGTPPIAPAVVNAIRAATGQPVRSLPIRLSQPVQAGRVKAGG
jgi:isoquinoline 1-oxidoreductase beta subunit